MELHELRCEAPPFYAIIIDLGPEGGLDQEESELLWPADQTKKREPRFPYIRPVAIA